LTIHEGRNIGCRKLLTLSAAVLVLSVLFYGLSFHDATAVGTFSKYFLAFVPCAAAHVVRGPVNYLLPYHGAPVLGIFSKIITGFVPCAAVRLVRVGGIFRQKFQIMRPGRHSFALIR
jgi:hypothetical protein